MRCCAGSYYGVLYYFRNMADTGIAFRQRQPILDNFGAFLGQQLAD